MTTPSVFEPTALSFYLPRTQKKNPVPKNPIHEKLAHTSSWPGSRFVTPCLVVASSFFIHSATFGLVILVTGCAATPQTSKLEAHSTETMTPIVIGRSFVMDSAVLGEKRTITVYLPDDYKEGTKRYPILYLLDGGADEDFHHITGIVQVSVANGLMEPIVVIGVKNTIRRRDMTGPTTNPTDLDRGKDVGGSAAFRSFLKTELIPRIDRDFRGNGERTLMGESLAGLFVVETFLDQPDMFHRYIAVSPSLWWNNGMLLKNAAERLTALPVPGKTFYLAVGGIEDNTKEAERFAESLRQSNPQGLAWYYEPLPMEAHGTMLHAAALRALRKFFPAKPHEKP